MSELFNADTDQNEWNVLLVTYAKILMTAQHDVQNGNQDMKGGLSCDPHPSKKWISKVLSLFEDFDQNT